MLFQPGLMFVDKAKSLHIDWSNLLFSTDNQFHSIAHKYSKFTSLKQKPFKGSFARPILQ